MTYCRHAGRAICHACHKFKAYRKKARVRYGTSRKDTDTKTIPLHVRLKLNQNFHLFFSNKKLSRLFECNSSKAETVFTKYSERSSSRCMQKEKHLITGGPSSSCEMIILRNNSHGGIIRVCMGIFTTALRNKKYVKFSKKKKPHLTSTVCRLLSDRLL